jgi:rhomboid protease GluP
MRTARSAIAIKLRYIYVPLIVLAARFLAVYSFLNWLLVVKTGLLPVADPVVDYWLPVVMSGILVLVFSIRRFGMLQPDGTWNWQSLSQVAAIGFLAVPTIIAQGYIRAASGDITRVKDAGEIGAATPTKFYFADRICVNYSGSQIETVAVNSRRSGQATLNVYIVEPICPGPGTTTGGNPVWIGLKASTSFDNSVFDEATRRREPLDPETIQKKFYAFIQEVDAQFRSEDPHSYRFLERVGRNADAGRFAAALRHAGNDPDRASATILIPHKEAFGDRTGQRLPWVFGSYAIGAIAWFGISLVLPLDRARFRRWRKPKAPVRPIE